MSQLYEEIKLQEVLKDCINRYKKDFPQLLGLNLAIVLQTYFRGRFNIDQFIETQKEFMEKI